jgi:putative FmdB family regulatory protein
VPLYEYKCLKCGRHTEKIESVAGPHLAKCPQCGGKVESVITAPAIKFKGAGWYVNDYAGKSNASEAAKSEADSGPSKDSKDGAKEATARDSSAKDSGSKEASAKEAGAKDSGLKDSKEKKTAKKK